jgi:Spy/CpxP family protein refolding chaperone
MKALVAIAVAAGLAVAAGPAHAGPARERIEERLRAARDEAVARQLDLDPAAMAKLAAVLARHDDALDRHRAEARRLRRAIDDAIASGDQRAMDAAVEAMLVHRRGLTGLEEARLRAARAALTPEQAARLAIVLPLIERRMENRIRRVLERRRGRGERWRDRPATGSDR